MSKIIIVVVALRISSQSVFLNTAPKLAISSKVIRIFKYKITIIHHKSDYLPQWEIKP